MSAPAAILPKHLIGVQMSTFRGVIAGAAEGPGAEAARAAARRWLDALAAAGCSCLELDGGAGRWGFGPDASPGGDQLGRRRQRAEVLARGMSLPAAHGGPAPGVARSDRNVDAELRKAAASGLESIGFAGGASGAGWAGPAASNSVAVWLEAAAGANDWGLALQQGDVAGVRWFGHSDSVEWAVIPEGNEEWSGRRFLEIAFEELDPGYAFCEVDLGMARRRGALDTDRLFLDHVLEYANAGRIEHFHVKGTDGEVDVDPGPADVVPWQPLFNGLRDPGAHRYLWERDGGPDGLEGDPGPPPGGPIAGSIDAFAGLLHGTAIDRSIVGAPANLEPPAIGAEHPHRPGRRLRVERLGVWERAAAATYGFRWVRIDPSGAHAAVPGSAGRSHVTGDADAGKRVYCEVTARTRYGATQANTEPVEIAPS